MVKIKGMLLKNYCGYRDIEFDFSDSNGNIKQLAMFYGPNGTGKTTFLDAVNMCCNAHQYENRDCSVAFSKIIYHKDYNPTTTTYEQRLAKIEGEYATSETFRKKVQSQIKTMEIASHFVTKDNEDKFVVFSSDGPKAVLKNDLPRQLSGNCVYFDADKPTNMNRFQLNNNKKDIFLDMARIVYGFDCSFGSMITTETLQNENIDYITDVIINKYGDMIHFKRMSAGEKKIAKLIQKLCSDEVEQNDLICIDNVFMHIYFKRHAKLIDKMLDVYPDKQFILTCHSGTAIKHVRDKYGEKYLYDLEKYKIKDLKLNSQEMIS